MRLRNLTPHSVTIVEPDGTPAATLPPDGQVARVAEDRWISANAQVAPPEPDRVELDRQLAVARVERDAEAAARPVRRR